MEILEQLRQAREAQGLDLQALEHRTRLRIHLLEAVEQGRFADLPRGVYARAVVRAYAAAVGMDPNRVITAVESLLPGMEDPLDGIARVRGFSRSTAQAPEPAGERGVSTDQNGGAEAGHPAPALASSEGGGSIGASVRPACVKGLAGCVDASLLLGIHLAVTVLGARVAGVPTATFAEVAGPALFMLFLLIGTLYFVLLGGVRGATVGARLVGLAAPRRPALDARTISARALEAASRELSIVIDLALPLVAAWLPPGRSGGGRSDTRAEDPVAVR